MFPSDIASELNARGHDAVTPADVGAHNLPDDMLIEIATEEHRVIVTENASDFAHVTTCSVVFVRKSWWPPKALAAGLSSALDRWARVHAEPGPWPHWLEEEYR